MRKYIIACLLVIAALAEPGPVFSGEQASIERGYAIALAPGHEETTAQGNRPRQQSINQGPVAVYLIPLADFPESLAAELARSMSRELDLHVKASVRLPPLAVDTLPGSNQLVADEIMTQGLNASARLLGVTPETYRVFLTTSDINERSGNFRFQFSRHAPMLRSSVVSLARLVEYANRRPVLTQHSLPRLHKLTKRAIGENYFGWQRSSNPDDLMYAPLMSVADLDRMGSDHTEAPVVEHGNRLMQMLAQGRFKECAEAFHYPHEYSPTELEDDKGAIAYSLTHLIEEIGGIENIQHKLSADDGMLAFDFGGGSFEYWTEHPKPVRTVTVNYEAKSGRDGLVYFHLTYVQFNSQWQVRGFRFQLPAARMGAKERMIQIASQIQPPARR
ncbi:MAG: hypothetical protein LBE33_05125 [Zoogloeaceae bacterium]|jgi:predicted Zn-dependent protease|nr:hypothetical protein [Zoogloeaceae bacterium]